MDTLKIAQNQKVKFRDSVYTITHVLNLERVILRNDFTGEKRRATIAELEPSDKAHSKSQNSMPLEGFTPEQWDAAEAKLEIIRPLMNPEENRTSDDVTKVANKNKVAPSTVYRWLSLYESTGRLSSLVRSGRKDKGNSRIDNDSETLITEIIENYYLTSKKVSIAKAYNRLSSQAKRANIATPSKQTFTRRIKVLKRAKASEHREGKQESRAKYSGAPGKYDEAKFPLSVVQIDHTPVDLMFVDEDSRESIGRAWLTVAICVFSRMVHGYYLTFEAPSAMSVGQCLINSVLPKEQWLQERDVESSWPIWGLMSNLHADNGKDFRSKSLDLSCHEYGININWRPLGRADFGGHIERLLGTFNKDIHELEGTTFSNIQQKGRYKSEQRAIFTLGEFDKWLCTYITNIYHQSRHSGIKMSPLEKLEEGYLGTDELLGAGLPDRILDEPRLRMDFLPVIYRTVQRHGIEIDYIRYYSTAISKWIREKNPDPTAPKGKFVVKRDPRNINKIYFLDPEINEYLEIPCVNRAAPSMTLWELREINKKLAQDSVSSIDQDVIFKAREDLIRIEESAKNKTKHARRKNTRIKEAKKSIKREKASSASVEKIEAQDQIIEDDIFGLDIEPFDDLRGSD